VRRFPRKHNHLMWNKSFSKEIDASPPAIWSLFRNVNTWKQWNAGVEEMEIFGSFAAGTEFRMKPSGQNSLTLRLLEVRENELFVDETRVEDLTVIVSHRIEALGTHRSRVTFTIEAYGPGCEEAGPAISADFHSTLDSLASSVGQRSTWTPKGNPSTRRQSFSLVSSNARDANIYSFHSTPSS